MPGFVPDVAITLWLEMFGVAAAVLAASAAIAWWQHRRTAPAPSVWRQRARQLTADDAGRLFAEIDALTTHAIAAAAAATRAESRLERLRVRAVEAQRDREVAWHGYDTAQRAYANVMRHPAISDEVWPMTMPSGAWPVLVPGGAGPAQPALVPAPRPVPTGAALVMAGAPALARPGLAAPDPTTPQLPASELTAHDLSRAALAAYRRGHLSVEQLREVFRRFSGWDARHEQHEREVLRRRAAEREAHRRYTVAAAAERDVNHEIDVAVVAARAWADEAVEAAEDARLARVFVDEYLRHAAIRRRLRSLGY